MFVGASCAKEERERERENETEENAVERLHPNKEYRSEHGGSLAKRMYIETVYMYIKFT